MPADRPVDRAFTDHDAFERDDDGYVVTSTPFDATARATAVDDQVRLYVTVIVPTLPAVVEDQQVGEAVADGWYETFELRLADAYDVIHGDPRTDPPAVSRDPADAEIHIQFSIATDTPDQGVDDAVALVDFVEGTYVQGVIPGYEYGDPVRSLIRRARQAGGDSPAESEDIPF